MSLKYGGTQMIGLGTLINVVGIVLGGIIGMLAGKRMNERIQDTLGKASGIAVLFIAVAGVMEGMLSIKESSIVSGRAMLVVICIILGAFIGELLNIESLFEKFGEWLKVKTGSAKDLRFVDGFVTASLTVCIGAMAVVGSIQDGIFGDYTTLTTKAVLDLIIVMVMTCSLGKGCIFSAIPVGVFQGLITVLARLIKPLMTDAALVNLSLIGSILIFCVGINLVWGKRIRVANFLPSIIFAVAAAFLPFNI